MAASTSIDGFESLMDKLDSLSSEDGDVSAVKVGIVKTAKYPLEVMEGRQRRKTTPTVAQVALWNEFGTKGGGWGGPIPERPFMRNSVEKFRSDERVGLLLSEVFVPDQEKMRLASAKLLGQILKGIMQEEIRAGDFEPNAPATIAIKTKGKGGPTTPLIDTGLMRRSIDYEVVGEGEEVPEPNVYGNRLTSR